MSSKLAFLIFILLLYLLLTTNFMRKLSYRFKLLKEVKFFLSTLTGTKVSTLIGRDP